MEWRSFHLQLVDNGKPILIYLGLLNAIVVGFGLLMLGITLLFDLWQPYLVALGTYPAIWLCNIIYGTGFMFEGLSRYLYPEKKEIPVKQYFKIALLSGPVWIAIFTFVQFMHLGPEPIFPHF